MSNVSFQVIEKMKTYVLYSINCPPPPPENHAFIYNVEKCGRAGQTTADDITRRTSVACGITNGTYIRTQTHTQNV